MGIGGKVVNNDCIECPFHGWLYDGKTGQCVGTNNSIKIMMANVL
jgi:cholesterol 7-dehydrogenase